MRKILIPTISLLVLLSLGLSWAIPQERIIYFENSTTLEEAATSLATYNLAYESEFRWEHPNAVTTWRGGIQYNPARDNIIQVRNNHWKHYYNLLLTDISTIEKRVDVTASTENNPQYAALTNEKTALDQTVLNCWLNDTCPPVPVVQIRAQVNGQELITEITELPIVNRIENFDSPSGFFSLIEKLLH